MTPRRMGVTVIAFVVLICLCTVQSQPIQRCIFSREDYLPCKYQNKDLKRAEDNQYSIHHTKLRETGGIAECNVRAKEQYVGDITDLGTHEMRIMYSPGFINGIEYDNQLRVEYLVQCEPDELAFFNMTHLNIQGPEDCKDEHENNRCQDYVQILRGRYGISEVCGTLSSTDTVVLQLEFGNYTVVFRSSEEVRGEGFEMYSICFKPAERDLSNCFRASEFNSGVCALHNETQPPTSRTKRAAGEIIEERGGFDTSYPVGEIMEEREEFDTPYPVGEIMEERGGFDTPYPLGEIMEERGGFDTFYPDLIPGYPADLKMAKDLAKFDHEWQRTNRRTDGDHIKRDILYNQTVNYMRNTLSILDPNDRVVAQYRVEILKTFDSTGTVNTYVGGVLNDETPHLRGAGVLKIYRRRAYFQLFVIDPRGLLPNAEEQLELIAMNTQLLKSVPAEEDFFFIDKYQEPADLGRHLYRERREPDAELTDADEEAVLAALRNIEACNPVLRAQSRATLAYYTGINAAFVEDLQTFDISCTLSGNVLTCNSASTILPDRTMCQTDDDPFPCEPFTEPIPIQSTAVHVTAINCVGQRAALQVLSLSP